MTPAKDLIVLAADKDAEQALSTLLKERMTDLGLRPITCSVVPHPQHDPAVVREAHHFLRGFLRSHQRALVVFDHEGCGQERREAAEVGREVQQRLDQNGWHDRSAVIAIAPELEIWAWLQSPRVAKVMGWPSWSGIYQYALSLGLWQADAPKPSRPKELMAAALREKRVAWSSSLFAEIARVTDPTACRDPQFRRLLSILSEWFPASKQTSHRRLQHKEAGK